MHYSLNRILKSLNKSKYICKIVLGLTDSSSHYFYFMISSSVLGLIASYFQYWCVRGKFGVQPCSGIELNPFYLAVLPRQSLNSTSFALLTASNAVVSLLQPCVSLTGIHYNCVTGSRSQHVLTGVSVPSVTAQGINRLLRFDQ